MMTRTHAPTTIAQSPTSIEYRLKLLYLALLSIVALGHLLWSYTDYNLCREQYSVTYTQTSQALVSTDTTLSIIRKHVPQQSDIDKIVRNIESHVIHGLELPIQAQDLVKAYQTSTCFDNVYHYITDGKLPAGAKAQACI